MFGNANNTALIILSALVSFIALLAVILTFKYMQHKTTPTTLVILLKGRLGNQLFQVAAAEYFRRIAIGKGNTQVVYKRNRYSLETDLSAHLFRSLPHFNHIDEACPTVANTQRTNLSEIRFSCDPIGRERLRGSCIVVDGFFQCPRYAEAGRELVIKMLLGSKEYVKATEKFRRLTATADGRPVVAMHVRRGDYTKRFNRGFLEPLAVEYYVRATRSMPAECLFLVFSDDIKWCRRELPISLRHVGKENLVFVDEKNSIAALILMMLGDHNIIANSTFSWWGAFLNGNTRKKVCAPKHWFGSRVKQQVFITAKNWMTL